MNSDGAGSADLAAPVFYADPHELARALERLRDHVRADAIHATPTLLDGPIAPVDELEAVCSLLRGMPPGAAPLPTTRPTRVSAFCFVHHAIDGTSGHTSKLVRADIVLAQRGYRYVEIELWQRSVEGIYFS